MRRLRDKKTWHDPYDWSHLALWTDPALSHDISCRFAEIITKHARADSFITIEESKKLADGSTIVDPNNAFDTRFQFIPHPTARPKSTKQSRADGITGEQKTKTYLKRWSKVFVKKNAR